jgi:hypothetical protein
MMVEEQDLHSELLDETALPQRLSRICGDHRIKSGDGGRPWFCEKIDIISCVM